MARRSQPIREGKPPPSPGGRESFRETADSIVIAFILAFVFRAFVVEAFVIPTGSMAPTLYGQHATISCEFCGFSFAYGLRDASSRSRGGHGPDSKALCPNCQRPNTNLVQNDRARNSEAGDRILVLKWPLDIGGPRLATQRWDVTVFKDPADGVTNFIKRIVGLPEEVLSIIDGDVYAVPLAELSASSRQYLADQIAGKVALQYGPGGEGLLEHLPESVHDELEQKLRIARKTHAAQQSLWFNLYNHDYLPSSPVSGQPRWVAERAADSSWNSQTRTISFDGIGRSPEFIELVDGLARDAYGYNLTKYPSTQMPLHPRAYGENSVDDLRVRFVLSPRHESGLVRVQLGKREMRFVATVGMNGDLSISIQRKGSAPAEGLLLKTARPRLLSPSRAVEVAFQVVDYRVSLWINGQEVLATTHEQYKPDIKSLKKKPHWPVAAPRLWGEDAAFDILHLAVHRDVYYRKPAGREIGILPRWSRHLGGWASADNPMMLRKGEYFALGDNSPQSQDSRVWATIGPHLQGREDRFQLGTIPEDQLVGRAFFVYWPSGHRLRNWLPVLGKYGIIPNVGRMRWIR